MEMKMKEICAGTKTRGDVVHESLDMYRDVYIRTRRGINILKAVSGIMRGIQMNKC
jgi:DNA topoisomerase-3